MHKIFTDISPPGMRHVQSAVYIFLFSAIAIRYFMKSTELFVGTPQLN